MRRRNDYRLTRNGKGVDIHSVEEKVLRQFNIECFNCGKVCPHDQIEKFAGKGEGKRSYQLRCTSCGAKRFHKFADDSNYDTPSARIGRAVQAFQEYLWDWLSEHIDNITSFEVPDRVNIFRGRIGKPRRNKGKPTFSSSELHPEFLAYLDTPDYIKVLSDCFKKLEVEDPDVLDFILFKAYGYSLQQINKAHYFSKPVTRTNPRKNKLGQDSYVKTEFCKILNDKAVRFLIQSIPPDLLQTFGKQKDIEVALNTAFRDNNKKKRSESRHERVTCPRCDGKDNNCILCLQKKYPWDGTIPVWLRDSYLKKVANGEWKE